MSKDRVDDQRPHFARRPSDTLATPDPVVSRPTTLATLLREAREYVNNVYVLTRNDPDQSVANEAADLMRRIEAALVLFG